MGLWRQFQMPGDCARNSINSMGTCTLFSIGRRRGMPPRHRLFFDVPWAISKDSMLSRLRVHIWRKHTPRIIPRREKSRKKNLRICRLECICPGVLCTNFSSFCSCQLQFMCLGIYIAPFCIVISLGMTSNTSSVPHVAYGWDLASTSSGVTPSMNSTWKF